MKSGRGAEMIITSEFRCSACGALLGKLEGEALSIRRGDLQATIDGDFRASLVCYRRRCKTLNVVRLPSARPATTSRRP